MFDAEGYVRARSVLERALSSTSRVTRTRAISMLARCPMPERERWLERACTDSDEAVRETARTVLAWVAEPAGDRPWPDREDPAFDRVAPCAAHVRAEAELPAPVDAGWQYVLEVWRDDGMLVGVYFALTREDDDEHARRMALGQAIMASAGPLADRFDPETAAVFIVDKRQAGGRVHTAREWEGWSLGDSWT